MCNPSLWTGKDWQCYNKSFPAADERMCRNKKLGNRKRDFSNFPNLVFLDPPPLSSAMVSICLMPLPPGHPPSDLRDPPFPLRTFKFKHKHFLSCHFNEHRCFWNLVEILEKVWNFGNFLKFWKKFEILEKIWNFGKKLKFWKKNWNFWKFEILEKNLNFWKFLKVWKNFEILEKI